MNRTVDRLRQITRRLYTRAPVALGIRYRTASSFLVSYTVNLSRGGLFVETEEPLAEGTRVALEIEAPGIRPAATTAVVVWVRKEPHGGEPAGMGMRFEESGDERWGELVDGMVAKFSGLSIAAVGASAVRCAAIGRLVRGVLTCRIHEIQPASAPIEHLSAPFDLAIVDFDGGAAVTKAIGALRAAGTPIIALAHTADTREIAKQCHGVNETLDASPSPNELRAAVLRTVGRPQVERR